MPRHLPEFSTARHDEQQKCREFTICWRGHAANRRPAQWIHRTQPWRQPSPLIQTIFAPASDWSERGRLHAMQAHCYYSLFYGSSRTAYSRSFFVPQKNRHRPQKVTLPLRTYTSCACRYCRTASFAPSHPQVIYLPGTDTLRDPPRGGALRRQPRPRAGIAYTWQIWYSELLTKLYYIQSFVCIG